VDPYRLPFAVDRTRAPRLRLCNTGPERLRGVCLLLTGRGVMAAPATSVLDPGDSVDFRVLGRDLERDTTVVVRWIRPDGAEYLWRVAL
jgi:hypothetical protein